MSRAFFLILLLSFTSSVVADLVPCIKWKPVEREMVNEILGDVSTIQIQDISGKVSELVSEKCWLEHDMLGDYSQIGHANIISTPVMLEPGVCKSEYLAMGLENGEWSPIYPERRYAITRETNSACNEAKIEDFIFLENPIEDSTAMLLLQSADEIYSEYLKAEGDAYAGLHLTSIGLWTTQELNTYYRLNFGLGTCGEVILLVRINKNGKPEYVAHQTLLC